MVGYLSGIHRSGLHSAWGKIARPTRRSTRPWPSFRGLAQASWPRSSRAGPQGLFAPGGQPARLGPATAASGVRQPPAPVAPGAAGPLVGRIASVPEPARLVAGPRRIAAISGRTGSGWRSVQRRYPDAPCFAARLGVAAAAGVRLRRGACAVSVRGNEAPRAGTGGPGFRSSRAGRRNKPACAAQR